MKNRIFYSSLFVLALGACGRSVGEAHIVVQGSGLVTSNPEGIACGNNGASSDCEAALGRTFILTAVAADGSTFDHWEGDEVCTDARQATVAVSKAPDRTVECTAVFVDSSAGNTSTL